MDELSGDADFAEGLHDKAGTLCRLGHVRRDRIGERGRVGTHKQIARTHTHTHLHTQGRKNKKLRWMFVDFEGVAF